MKDFDLEDTLARVNQYHFKGNIIPASWYKKIRFPHSLKQDFVSIILLSEIVFWYRTVPVYDDHTKELIGRKKRFSGDMLQYSLQNFSDKFGLEKRLVSESLKRLHDLDLIYKELRTITTGYQILGNVLHLAPKIDAIIALDDDSFILDPKPHDLKVDTPTTSRRDSYHVSPYELSRSDVGAITSQRSTYTKKPTKITTNINKTLTNLDTQNSKSFSEEKSKSQKIGSVNFLKTKNISLDEISDALTQEQIQIVKTKFEALQEELEDKLSSPATLIKEIEFCLLDTNSFTECEQSFYRKLAAIFSVIRGGKWRTPFALQSQTRNQLKVEKEITNKAQIKIKRMLAKCRQQLHEITWEQNADENYLAEIKKYPESKNHNELATIISQKMQEREASLVKLQQQEKQLTEELNAIGKENSSCLY